MKVIYIAILVADAESALVRISLGFEVSTTWGELLTVFQPGRHQ